VSRLVEGGSAQAAGILPGDVITEIDGVQTRGWSLEQIRAALQGAEDTFVTVGRSEECIARVCRIEAVGDDDV
jgi:C-terminal processing protease CtpA/Prc